MADYIPNSAIFHDLALVLGVYVSTPPERVARRMADLLMNSAVAIYVPRYRERPGLSETLMVPSCRKPKRGSCGHDFSAMGCTS